MGYLTDLVDECNKLSAIAQEYLAQFDDNKSMGDLAQDIWDKAWEKLGQQGFTEHNWWDCEDDEVTHMIDIGDAPYATMPRNGSLRYTLGWSIVAQEANLRAFHEYFVNGKELIKFKMLAGEDVRDKDIDNNPWVINHSNETK